MTELLKAVASWPSLLLLVIVFGFAPGFCLRLIVLAYPSDNPRRTELIAELYAVPRIKRPLWVAEQLEVALFEGLGYRISAAIRRWRIACRTGKTIGGVYKDLLLVVLCSVVGLLLRSISPTWYMEFWVVMAIPIAVFALPAWRRLRRRGPIR